MTSLEVEDLIRQIPENKFYDLYSCPIYIFKLSKYIVSAPLATMINMPIENGTFPSKLKIAKIVPVLKSGDRIWVIDLKLLQFLIIFLKKYNVFVVCHRVLFSVLYFCCTSMIFVCLTPDLIFIYLQIHKYTLFA